MDKRLLTFIIWFLSMAFLFVGNRVAAGSISTSVEGGHTFTVTPGIVTQITERLEQEQEIAPGISVTNTFVAFTVRVRGRGEVAAQQNLSDSLLTIEKEVEAGDRVLIFYDEMAGVYHFVDYVRINYIIVLASVLFGLMILFGGAKGVNSIVALGFTCMAIFLVLVPSVLSGRNIYATAIIVCTYIIVSTLALVVGPSKKAASAMLGCLGGVFFAGLLMLFMDPVLTLTGVVDQESQFLLALPPENAIELRPVVFAGVTIGAVGAIMDVAMSIASGLWEVSLVGGAASFGKIFRSGINIGKDILGTMLNTLILAYIGSSLSLILLITFYAQSTSLMELFNREAIVVEFLRALVGSFGIFLTIPLTSAICGWLYAKGRMR